MPLKQKLRSSKKVCILSHSSILIGAILTKIREFVRYASHILLKYQNCIRIFSPLLVNYNKIVYKYPHS